MDCYLCVSDSTTPRPTPNPKAEYVPLAPRFYICLIKSCCSDFGVCGLTSEFCVIKNKMLLLFYSNCGLGELPKRKASSFKEVVYWLDTTGSFSMDVSKVTGYDILHYSFATIWVNLLVCDLIIFWIWIIAFGDLDFSTDPSTYQRFKIAVSSGREKLASNLVNFMNSV